MVCVRLNPVKGIGEVSSVRMSEHDAIALTRSLLRFETVNPPGRERDCARHAGALLEQWGFRVEYHEYAEARTSVIARAGGSPSKAPLCLTGHLDVVPLGARAWTRDPFAGETQGDRLYGRGSSDMKAGVAAMLLASRNISKKISSTPGIVLVLTAAEEGGCIGSYHLAQTQLLGKAGAMIVGEPTANYPYVGHKGSLKFYAGFRGTSAHGSMPELGVNAIYKAARAVSKLEAFDFAQLEHPVMGRPTMNVGTFEGGQGVNMVPDAATIGVDIRTLPGMDHQTLLARIGKLLGGEAELDVFSDMPAVWTSPEEEWVQGVFEICKRHLGAQPEPRTAAYNTHAGNLLKVYRGAPTVVLGPGDPHRSRRHYRQRLGGEGAARRPHAAPCRGKPYHHRLPLREASLPPDQRLHRHRTHWQRGLRADDQRRCPGEEPEGIHRLFEIQPRQAQLRLGGQRQRDAPVDGVPGEPHRPGHGARAAQVDRRGDQRRNRRPPH